MLPLEKFKRISPTAELGSALPQMVKESINCPFAHAAAGFLEVDQG
jgi:hypothetical protein